MSPHDELTLALRELESALESAGLWNEPRPAPIAFESRQPFCVDTMTLPQWLRYVLVARLQALIGARAPLPASCSVTPALEMWMKDFSAAEREGVLRRMAEVDRVITEA